MKHADEITEADECDGGEIVACVGLDDVIPGRREEPPDDHRREYRRAQPTDESSDPGTEKDGDIEQRPANVARPVEELDAERRRDGQHGSRERPDPRASPALERRSGGFFNW